MNPETKIKILFNTVMFLLGALIPFMFMNQCGSPGEQKSTKDTIVSLAPPVTNNFEFTNPTVYKEKTIVYDSTRHNEMLTRKDSDLIVFDYLKRRYYADSIMQKDSSMAYYFAEVEKNGLVKIDIKTKYRPKVFTVNNYIEPGNALVIGGELNYRYEAQIPSFSVWSGFESKKYYYGIRYDLLQKQGAFMAGRRLNFKRRKGT